MPKPGLCGIGSGIHLCLGIGFGIGGVRTIVEVSISHVIQIKYFYDCFFLETDTTKASRSSPHHQTISKVYLNDHGK